jgi:hypothetical protein
LNHPSDQGGGSPLQLNKQPPGHGKGFLEKIRQVPGTIACLAGLPGPQIGII